MNPHYASQVRVHQKPQAVFQLGDGICELDNVRVFVCQIAGQYGQHHARANSAEYADQGINTVDTGCLQLVIVYPLIRQDSNL